MKLENRLLDRHSEPWNKGETRDDVDERMWKSIRENPLPTAAELQGWRIGNLVHDMQISNCFWKKDGKYSIVALHKLLPHWLRRFVGVSIFVERRLGRW